MAFDRALSAEGFRLEIHPNATRCVAKRLIQRTLKNGILSCLGDCAVKEVVVKLHALIHPTQLKLRQRHFEHPHCLWCSFRRGKRSKFRLDEQANLKYLRGQHAATPRVDLRNIRNNSGATTLM